MIKEWLEAYQLRNKEDARDALREIMQEIALAGLYRAGFFDKAAFYGGTALRIFHGLNRFSEDLDFSLLEVDPDFSLEFYQEAIVNEFSALGMQVSVAEKIKKVPSNINSAFLKSETLWRELVLENTIPQIGIKDFANIKIKIEVDTKPPLGFSTDELLLLRPFSFYIKCLSLPDLFAGKMHALLFRKWGNNVKGRDWYDMEWYIRQGHPMHLNHFLLRALDSGDWHKATITEAEFRALLQEKINQVNLDFVKADISRFINDTSVLNIWSVQYFQDLAKRMKILT